ncbi:MAG: hypothetical protein QOK02_2721 [Mycobacterium sp.]|nr:hypothetical protein [Mycobacterium sp.]
MPSNSGKMTDAVLSAGIVTPVLTVGMPTVDEGLDASRSTNSLRPNRLRPCARVALTLASSGNGLHQPIWNSTSRSNSGYCCGSRVVGLPPIRQPGLVCQPTAMSCGRRAPSCRPHSPRPQSGGLRSPSAAAGHAHWHRPAAVRPFPVPFAGNALAATNLVAHSRCGRQTQAVVASNTLFRDVRNPERYANRSPRQVVSTPPAGSSKTVAVACGGQPTTLAG